MPGSALKVCVVGGWVLKVNLVIALAELEPSLSQAEQLVSVQYKR